MDPDALYEIHVDNTGDAVEDLTYQFKFNNQLKGGRGVTLNIGGKDLPIALRHIGPLSTDPDPDLGESESYTLTLVTGDRRSGVRAPIVNANGGSTTFTKPFDNAGNKSIPGYPAYADQFITAVTIPGCAVQAKVFAGQRAEYFAVNLGPIFDLVNFIPIQGAPDPTYSSGAPFPGGITQSQDNQELIGKKNVTTLAIEVPIACLTGTGNGSIGVWSTASLPQARLLKPNPTFASPAQQGGAFVQVSRLGMPLVNEVVIGLPQKDLFNAVKPTADGAVADYVTNPTFPAILDALFRGPVNATLNANFTNLAPSNFPRNDLVATFLTGIATLNQLKTITPSEMIRLNTAVPPTAQASQSTFGVVGNDLAGFPNGRRPGDDTVDIVLRVAMADEVVRLIDEQIAALRPIAEKGFVSQTRMRELERARAEIDGQQGQYSASVAQTREASRESELQMLEALRSFRERIAADLREVENSLGELLPKWAAARDQLARTAIRAPATGAVVGMSIFTPGGVIAPGQKLMDIVPEKVPLKIQARIAPNDADDLVIGQRTLIKFPGLHERTLPSLEGQLTRLSADSFADEKSGLNFFTGEITVPRDQLRLIEAVRGQSFALRAWMPVEVLIPLKKRTALDYALEPLIGSFWGSFREQ